MIISGLISGRSLSRSVLLLATAGLLSLCSCKDSAPAKQTAAVPASDAAARPALGANTAAQAPAPQSLLSLVPSDAGAFFLWDLSSPAYDKLLASRWGNSYLSRTQTLASQMPELGALLKDAGLDLSNSQELKKKVREALALLTKPASGTANAVGGLVLRTPDAATASQVTAALKAAIEKRGTPTTPIDGGYSFEMDLPNKTPVQQGQVEGQPPVAAAQPKRLKLLTKAVGDRIILADDPAIMARLATGPAAGERPAPMFAKLAADAPPPQERVALGYVDAVALLNTEKEKQETPVTAAFLSVKMTDRPTVQIRLQKRPGVAPAKIETVVPAKEILAAFPVDPILFTTMQAGVIRDMATGSSPDAANFMNDSQFAPLKSITQLAVGAKAAVPGQSMLPIPELIISVVTTQPKEFAEQMLNSAQAAVKGYGLPGTLSEKTIAGKKVSILPGAFGLSLFVAQLDAAVLAATSEALLVDALTKLAQPDPFAGSTLPATAIQSVKAGGIGRLYLSFPEVVKLLESAKEMTGAMAAGPDGQQSAAQQALSTENMKALSDLGTLLGSMTDQGDELRGEITYL